MKLRWHDITPVVSDRLGVFPGDVRYARKVSLSFNQGHQLALSSIETTLHIGAHADAPSHYDKEGCGIGARDLAPYIGRTQVIDAPAPRGVRVARAHLHTDHIEAKRVLLRTGSFPNPEVWNSDFCGIEPDLIDWFAEHGVVLIGIDTPSIDPENSKSLESHARVRAHGMAILEGIDLSGVPDGLYALVALPLKLEGADASPVRAILLPDGSVLD